MLVRVVDGRLVKNDRIKMMATGATYNADKVGVFTPTDKERPALETGEVGYIIAGIRELQAAKVGELIAGRAKAAGIDSVVFDHGGHGYHGRIAALADAARAGGLKF